MGMYGTPILGVALALTVRMAKANPRQKAVKRYSQPLGPPYPTTRQQRRQMERQSRAALASMGETHD